MGAVGAWQHQESVGVGLLSALYPARRQPGPRGLLQGLALLLVSASLLPDPLSHPGRNVSRSCTDEGWSQLEPGPYRIACGLDDKASSLDEVGLSAPSPRPQPPQPTHAPFSLP